LTVELQPRVTLTRWAFVQADEDFYLVGFCLETDNARVSTAIERIDTDSMTVTTSSGREYRLTRSPASFADAAWIRDVWDRAIALQYGHDN
jgi:hypothetical protein